MAEKEVNGMVSEDSDSERMVQTVEFLVAMHPELLRKISAKFDVNGDVACIDVEFANGLDDLLPSIDLADRDTLCVRVKGRVEHEVMKKAVVYAQQGSGHKRVMIFDDSVTGVFVLRRQDSTEG